MIKRIGVIGAGIMGHGIAETCAIAGYQVVLCDVDDKILSKAIDKIKWSLKSLSDSKRIKESPDSVLSRMKTTTDIANMGSLDFVIEAVKEDSSVKRLVYEKLNEIISDNCLVASNTSTIPITELSMMNKHPDNFIGLHFFNPPVVMPIVEIIRGGKTGESTLLQTKELAKTLKKDSVIINKDIPGFLVNRLNDRLILEALTILEEGVSPKDLDAMAKFRLGLPMGICELLDFVGIDTVYYANQEMIKHGFNTRSSILLGEMVKSARTGMKSGQGFYIYPKINSYARPTIIPGKDMYCINPARLLCAVVNEAAWIIRNNVATKEDVEKSMIKGMNWPHGPLELADRFGIDIIVDELQKRLSASGESRYIPDPLLTGIIEKEKNGARSGKGFNEWNTISGNYETLQYIRIENYSLITINRPERLNALNEVAWKELVMALRIAMEDESVRSVFITGKGRAFSAGDDIEMMGKWQKPDDPKNWMETYAKPLIDQMLNYPKPIVTIVNGLSFGGGCELNLLADIVVASDEAMFSIPEGLIGAMPPIASSLGIALVNRKILRYALTGEWFSSNEALDIGIVDIVVPTDQLMLIMTELADKIAKLAPLSTLKIKETANRVKQSQTLNLQFAETALTDLANTADFKEGQKTFLKKQAPVWVGK